MLPLQPGVPYSYDVVSTTTELGRSNSIMSTDRRLGAASFSSSNRSSSLTNATTKTLVLQNNDEKSKKNPIPSSSGVKQRSTPKQVEKTQLTNGEITPKKTTTTADDEFENDLGIQSLMEISLSSPAPPPPADDCNYIFANGFPCIIL